jgi:hypothetical protein
MEGLDSGGQGPTSGCCAIEEVEEEELCDRFLEFKRKQVMSLSVDMLPNYTKIRIFAQLPSYPDPLYKYPPQDFYITMSFYLE